MFGGGGWLHLSLTLSPFSTYQRPIILFNAVCLVCVNSQGTYKLFTYESFHLPDGCCVQQCVLLGAAVVSSIVLGSVSQWQQLTGADTRYTVCHSLYYPTPSGWLLKVSVAINLPLQIGSTMRITLEGGSLWPLGGPNLGDAALQDIAK